MRRGKKHTIETRRKMSKAHQGKYLPPKTRRRMSESRQGAKNHNWKGGRNHRNDGYIMLLVPGHPSANSNGYIMEHRLVMGKYLGRLLNSEEVVHHVNEDRADNRRENLTLFSSKRKHLNFHQRL